MATKRGLSPIAGAKSEIGLFLTITLNEMQAEFQFDHHKYYDNYIKAIVPGKYRKRRTDMDRSKGRQVITFVVNKTFSKKLIQLGLEKFTSVYLIKYKRNAEGKLVLYSYDLKKMELIDGPEDEMIKQAEKNLSKKKK